MSDNTPQDSAAMPPASLGYADAIVVWRFYEAPAQYKALSRHGGDEDWLAFIPDSLADAYIGWMEEGSSFGCCDVSERKVPGGIVRIGAHA